MRTLQAVLLPRPVICQKLAVTKTHQPPFVQAVGTSLSHSFHFQRWLESCGRSRPEAPGLGWGAFLFRVPPPEQAKKGDAAGPSTRCVHLPCFSPISYSLIFQNKKQSGRTEGRFYCFVKNWKFFQGLVRSSNTLTFKSWRERPPTLWTRDLSWPGPAQA